MSFFKSIFLKSLKLRYIRKFIKSFNTASEINRFLNLDARYLFVENFGGENNPDHLIYWIRLNDKGNGFFALFNRVLRYYSYADYYNLIPVVAFSSDVMANDHSITTTLNPFEYFFLQFKDFSLKEVKLNKHIITSKHADSQKLYPSTYSGNEYSLSEDDLLNLSRRRYPTWF